MSQKEKKWLNYGTIIEEILVATQCNVLEGHKFLWCVRNGCGSSVFLNISQSKCHAVQCCTSSTKKGQIDNLLWLMGASLDSLPERRRTTILRQKGTKSHGRRACKINRKMWQTGVNRVVIIVNICVPIFSIHQWCGLRLKTRTHFNPDSESSSKKLLQSGLIFAPFIPQNWKVYSTYLANMSLTRIINRAK